MANDDLVDQLIGLVNSPLEAKLFVTALDEESVTVVASGLNKHAMYNLQRDAALALAIAELIIHIGRWRDHALTRALGLQCKAIVISNSQREFEAALALFTESEAIFKAYDEELEIAIGHVSRIWALACLQRYEEAFAAGEWAREVLTRHEVYRSLAALNNNLAAVYGRQGRDREALKRFQEVEAAYIALGEDGLQRRSYALLNQAIVLRNLGRFDESIAANEAALALSTELQQRATIARSEQNLGITYFLLGHINKAQHLLQTARDIFISDERYRDAILAELFVSNGLLHLRRFEDVLEICRRVKATFREAGTRFEVAQALLNEATALAGLNHDEEALAALAEARQIFVHEQNEAWQIYTDLEKAAILFRREQYGEAKGLALEAVSRLHALNLPLKEAEALLITAHAALAEGHHAGAAALMARALSITQAIDAPVLTYRALYLQGQLALAEGDPDKALSAYEAAIHELERLQGRIMVEFRADFLADKDLVYAHAADLCLRAGEAERALAFAERAKSRALLSMLSHHIDLRIEAKSPADQELVDQILNLRERLDRLYRRWETGETPGSTVNNEQEQESGEAARLEARQLIVETEDKIRALWHKLLVINTAYATDASLWQIQANLDQEALAEDTLLVEYFTLPQGLVAFLVTSSNVQAARLAVDMAEITRLQQKLAHNFGILQQVPHMAESFTRKAESILHDLYIALVGPWAGYASSFKRLIIVPHGPLHYLPFHALFDGRDYLLQHFQICTLPGSSFLKKETAAAPMSQTPPLVMGHTQSGRLSNVPREIETTARVLKTQAHLNEASTRRRFQEEAPGAPLIHVAAHGDFNAASPLFSGLYLEDGLLTTLDIFNLHLSASLVTLSACQTGRNVVSGGDELFGLTRAFLTAGAASLILTLWPVEDRSTTYLMETLYKNLLAGQDKIEALRGAQLKLLAGSDELPPMHPYYWAPFFLIGDSGPI